MELYETIRSRRSTRSYEDKPIPREVLGRLLEAAREAPSAKNLMPWKLVVVTDPETRARLAESGTYGKFLVQTPVVLAACADAVLAPKWWAVDTAIALEHVALAAAAEGLGSCWVGSFDEELARRLLGVPDSHRVVALLALGYPKERLDLSRIGGHLLHPTRTLEKLVSEGRFENPWKSES